MDIGKEIQAKAKSNFPLESARSQEETNELAIRQAAFIEGAWWAIKSGYTLEQKEKSCKP